MLSSCGFIFLIMTNLKTINLTCNNIECTFEIANKLQVINIKNNNISCKELVLESTAIFTDDNDIKIVLPPGNHFLTSTNNTQIERPLILQPYTDTVIIYGKGE